MIKSKTVGFVYYEKTVFIMINKQNYKELG